MIDRKLERTERFNRKKKEKKKKNNKPRQKKPTLREFNDIEIY